MLTKKNFFYVTNCECRLTRIKGMNELASILKTKPKKLTKKTNDKQHIRNVTRLKYQLKSSFKKKNVL